MSEEIQQPGEKYKNIERPLGKILLYNFLGGITWGLGVLIGTGIIISIAAFFVSKIDFIPILGQFLADILKSAQSNLTTR